MLSGQYVNLWAVEQFDLLRIKEWISDPELIKQASLSYYLSGSVEIEQWYRKIQNDSTVKVFAIKTKDGIHIGNIELSNLDFRAGNTEIGIFIGDTSYRNKGYGKDAVCTLLRFAFLEVNLHRIYARIAAFNERAILFFKSCGFIEEGKLREAYFCSGKYWDVLIYGLLGNEFKLDKVQHI